MKQNDPMYIIDELAEQAGGYFAMPSPVSYTHLSAIIEKDYKQLSCRKVHLLTSCNCPCTEGGKHSINAADERTAAQYQKPVRILP